MNLNPCSKVGYTQLALLEQTLMQEGETDPLQSQGTFPVSPPRSLADMQSCQTESAECSSHPYGPKEGFSAGFSKVFYHQFNLSYVLPIIHSFILFILVFPLLFQNMFPSSIFYSLLSPIFTFTLSSSFVSSLHLFIRLLRSQYHQFCQFLASYFHLSFDSYFFSFLFIM